MFARHGYNKIVWDAHEIEVVVLNVDIFTVGAECIVNAANSSLAHGSGIAGAILDRAGLEMQRECNRIGNVPTGKAVMTSSYKLSHHTSIKWIVHAVGPHYNS